MSIPVFGKPLKGVNYQERPGAYGFLRDSTGAFAVVRTPMGLFLPGGGIETGEDPIAGLRRELLEEIGYELRRADFVTQAVQFHWSEFYQRHFKKVGLFYWIEADPPATPQFQDAHELHWLKAAEVAVQLSQEFQRWAFQEALLRAGEPGTSFP